MIKNTINRRYKLFSIKNEHFLIDLDSNKLFWFFPGMVWFFPIDAYRLTDLRGIEEKENKRKTSKGLGGLIILSVFFTRFFSNIVPKEFWTKKYFTEFTTIFIVIELVAVLLAIVMRYCYSKRCEEKIFRMNLMVNESNQISLVKTKKVKTWLKCISATFIASLVIIFLFEIAVRNTNVVNLCLSIALFNGYIYTNLTFKIPDIIDYKIMEKENE